MIRPIAVMSDEQPEHPGTSAGGSEIARQITWFKAIRSQEALELISANRNAFTLLYIIAHRAQRTTKFNRHNLAPGEAFLGDHDECGMSEQEYRTAKKVLTKGGFATFQATNRGTIATLSDTRVFDINIERGNGQNNGQPTDSQQAATGQPTTTKNEKKEKKGNPAPERRQPWQVRKDTKAGLEMLDSAIRRINDDSANWVFGPAKETEQAMEFLRENQTEGWEERIKAMESNPQNQVRKDLKAGPKGRLQKLIAQRGVLRRKLKETIS